MSRSIVIVDELKEVVARLNAALDPLVGNVKFEYGTVSQLIKLINLNKGGVPQLSAYPVICVFMPFDEVSTNKGYNPIVTFPKIVIATLTQTADLPATRYENTFKPVLYPIYDEFKKQLMKQGTIIGNDPDYIQHKKRDIPSDVQADSSAKSTLTDYLDMIEITNLTLAFKSKSNCKT